MALLPELDAMSDSERKKYFREAYRVMKDAADGDSNEDLKNVSEAHFRCGVCYVTGYGVLDSDKNPKNAVSHFLKAASGKHINALYNLGCVFYHGVVAKQNHKTAFKFFMKAAQHYHGEAQNTLGVLFWNGQGTYQDLTLACYWWKKAAMKGNVRAAVSYGKCFYLGMGVTGKDVEKAKEQWEFASEAGSEIASELLEEYINGDAVDALISEELDAVPAAEEDTKKKIKCTFAGCDCQELNADNKNRCKCGHSKIYHEEVVEAEEESGTVQIPTETETDQKYSTTSSSFKENNDAEEKEKEEQEKYEREQKERERERRERENRERRERDQKDKAKQDAERKAREAREEKERIERIERIEKEKARKEGTLDDEMFPEDNETVQQPQAEDLYAPTSPATKPVQVQVDSAVKETIAVEPVDDDDDPVAEKPLDPEELKTMSVQTLYELGIKKLKGAPGVKKNQPEAIFLFKMAGKKSHVQSWVELAKCQIYGHGCERDVNKATTMLKAAATKKHPEAQFLLGKIYWRKTPKLAHDWYKIAAQGGHVEANFNMGYLYMKGPSGIPKNEEKALHHYLIAARGGSAAAIKRLREDFHFTGQDYNVNAADLKHLVDEAKRDRLQTSE